MPISLPQLTGIITQAPPIGDYQGGARAMLHAQDQRERGRANLAREQLGKNELAGQMERAEKELAERRRQFEKRRAMEQAAKRREWHQKVQEAIADGGEMGPKIAGLVAIAPSYGVNTLEAKAILKQVHGNLTKWTGPIGGVPPVTGYEPPQMVPGGE